MDEGDFYASDKPRRGIALLISNEKFQGSTQLNKRAGAHADLLNLQMTFAQLGFQVRSYMDLTASKIIKRAREVADSDLDLNDYLVVAISTHGSKQEVPSEENYGISNTDFYDEIDLLHGTDGPFPVEDLLAVFHEEACPGLINKPKLFFFQGCRGDYLAETIIARLPIEDDTDAAAGNDDNDGQEEEEEDEVATGSPPIPATVDEVASHSTDARVYKQAHTALTNPTTLVTHNSTQNAQEMSTSAHNPAHSPARNDDNLVVGVQEGAGASASATARASQTAHHTLGPSSKLHKSVVRKKSVSKKQILRRDFLTMWSCPPGYFAFHRFEGSPFISYLCRSLQERHRREHLYSILTRVNRDVSTEYQCRHYDEYLNGRRIVPSIEHMLRKSVCLFPKHRDIHPCPVCDAA